MASTQITRRGLLGHSFGAYTALALGSGVIIAAADPLLALILDARDQEAFFNANTVGDDEHDDALAAATYEPLWDRLRSDPPMPTTNEGVAEAVRYAMKEYRQGGNPYALLNQVLAYLEAA